jgi:glycosyltransferase involved in cell wall biosynthesis
LTPKISVILVCYKQEKEIGRAIESVISQKEYLHELYISDDCSPDNTWQIIQEYAAKYPDKIKPFRHAVNQGVYENFQSTYEAVSGDIMFFLSGDDTLGNSLLKEVYIFLQNSTFNLTKDKFCILTDYKVVLNDGKEVINSNNALVTKHKNHFALKYRGIINNRALGESRAVFNERKNTYIGRDKNSKIPTSLQEGFFDILPFYEAKKIHYISVVGNVYYAGIGVSSRFTKHKNEYLIGLIEYCERSPEYFPNIDKYDLNWLKFHKAKSNYLLKPSFLKYISYWRYFVLLSFDPLRKYFLIKELKSMIKNFSLITSNN